MDIVKFFQSSPDNNVTINIQGTEDEPHFPAKQIGELLGMTNIRVSLAGFDDDEKVVSTTYSLGGPQSTTFLTELGLYRLLGQSRLAIARPFQKWVATVLKEIRQTGRYEIETRANERIAAANAAAEEQKAIAAKALAEVERQRTKTYEEVPKLDYVYVNKEMTESSNNIHKIGKALDPKKRLSQLNTGSARGITQLYARATFNAAIIEKVVEVVMRRYHYASLGGEEHYMCDVEHSINVIDVACTVIDTLAGAYEHIDRGVLVKKVVGNLSALICDGDTHIVQHATLIDMPASMSSLHYFLSLTADDEDRERLVQAPGWFVSYKLLQAAFARFVETASVNGLESRPERFSEDGVVAAGFVVERNVNCCNACGHYAPRPARCCDAFHADRRSKLKAVAGVRLVRT